MKSISYINQLLNIKLNDRVNTWCSEWETNQKADLNTAYIYKSLLS